MSLPIIEEWGGGDWMGLESNRARERKKHLKTVRHAHHDGALCVYTHLPAGGSENAAGACWLPS